MLDLEQMSSFLLGIMTGILLMMTPRIWTLHKKIGAIVENHTWWNTIRTILLYAEQSLKQSLKYDAARGAFVLSFILKGHLHQLLVLPHKGPMRRGRRDPFELGYEAVMSAASARRAQEDK